MSKKGTYSTKDRQRWREQLEVAIAQSRTIIEARTFKKGWSTKAQPVLLRCNDGKDYVVKGRNAGRQIINEQIVARLGLLLGAPVTDVQFVDLTKLIEIEKNLAHISYEIAHGSAFVPDCFDSRDLIATSNIENRSRLALLAVLYGWTKANDHQFLFKTTLPRLIYSVDHGHFFPNSPNWAVEDLLEADNAQVDTFLSKECHFTSPEINQALDALVNINEEAVIKIVALPPVEWGITIEERTMMIEYLIRRQRNLLALR